MWCVLHQVMSEGDGIDVLAGERSDRSFLKDELLKSAPDGADAQDLALPFTFFLTGLGTEIGDRLPPAVTADPHWALVA